VHLSCETHLCAIVRTGRWRCWEQWRHCAVLWVSKPTHALCVIASKSHCDVVCRALDRMWALRCAAAVAAQWSVMAGCVLGMRTSGPLKCASASERHELLLGRVESPDRAMSPFSRSTWPVMCDCVLVGHRARRAKPRRGHRLPSLPTSCSQNG
jgi:hypothetical protein